MSTTERMVVGLGVLSAALLAAPPVQADEPPVHVLSAQNLCNLVYPSSEAMPDPSGNEAVWCVRQGGALLRLARNLPAVFSNTFVLSPGLAPELPVGSVRVNPNDPLSDWIIPDCYVPDRVDCNPQAPGYIAPVGVR